MNKVNPPPLSEIQIKTLQSMRDGASPSSSHRNNIHVKEQDYIKSTDFHYMVAQKLIITDQEKSNALNTYYKISSLGIQYLNKKWEDPNKKANDLILESPEPQTETEFIPDSETESKTNPLDDEEETDHPAYGMISISKISGGETALFGSSIRHNNKISLSIKSAKLCRGLNNDRYHAKKQIVEVELSNDQFTSFISNANCGDGSPCTLRYIQGKRIENPPAPLNRRHQFTQEFKDTLSKLFKDSESLSAEANRLLNRSGALKKAEKDRINSLLHRVSANTKANLAFTFEQFQETLDKTVVAATSEVNGNIQTMIQSLGLEHLENALESHLSPPALEEKP
jgi:hypothetical protein